MKFQFAKLVPQIKITKKILLSINLIFWNVSLVALSYIFSWTPGLLYTNNNKLTSVSELATSGGNDNLSIEMAAALFLLPALIRILFIKDEIKESEIYLFFGLWLVQLILLATLEMGELINTILNGNYILLSWLILFFVVFIVYVVHFILAIRKPKVNVKMKSGPGRMK